MRPSVMNNPPVSPQRFGPYRVTRPLGRGGMGTVYAGADDAGQPAAIKVLSPALAAEPGFRSRFEAEIESLRKLLHPNIVRLYGFGEQDGLLFFAMELVDGSSLEKELQNGRRFSWQEVADLALQICRALRHAHDHGIIHRDIKPANLLLTADGAVKLTDFGIARLFGHRLTGAGGVVGTAEYMAPEQADGRPVTHQADLYSLGCVLYALLAGRPPFQAASFPAVLHMQRYEQAESLSVFAPETPKTLAAIVHRLLAKSTDERYPNAQVVARELNAVLEQTIDDVPLAAKSVPETTPADGNVIEKAAVEDDVEPAAQSVQWTTSRFTPVDRAVSAPEPASTLRTLLAPQTIVLALALFGLMIGLAYLLRGPSDDQVWQRIQAAAADVEAPDRLVQVEGDIDRLLAGLAEDDPRREALRAYRESIAIIRLDRKSRRTVVDSERRAALSPCERMFAHAIAYAETDPGRAAELLEAIVDLHDVPDETSDTTRRCVALARRQLERLGPLVKQQQADERTMVEGRLARADELRKTDIAAARKIWQAVIRHYSDQPWAAPWVAKAKAALEKTAGAK
jgi:serine/threonine protein kinase